MSTYDLVIANALVVRPDLVDGHDTERLDIGIEGGKIVALDAGLPISGARSVFDAQGRVAFPGAVDAHQHWGIYGPLGEDATSESRAAAQGGVTTALNYMRTGMYYMNRAGSYSDIFPEVLAATEGRAYVDYGYHLAPIQRSHLDEIGALIDDFGVASFKIFMFYGSHGLHGRSSDQATFLMTPPDERYDIAHFEFVMRAIQQAREQRPDIADSISLSMHCEVAEILTAYTKIVEEEGQLEGLAAYSASRPPHSEGLAIAIASYLAYETNLPNINLLHLSSAKAMDSAMKMAGTFPDVNFRREVTIGHLLADYDNAAGIGGKVNPPLRSRADVEALWAHVLAGDVDWVASDHACCREEVKFGEPRSDVFVAKSGFGGAEYLLPGLVSEGTKRGLSYAQVARLTAWNPARRYGLARKGTIAVGYDADVAIVDPAAPWTISAVDSQSQQEYTPFEGFELDAQVTDVFLRGQQILAAGKVVGEPSGTYLRRPQSSPAG